MANVGKVNSRQLELRELRNAFGTFMTGVTVVTTHEKNGTPRGFTANSFTSVSLDPPMLSICIGKSADSIEVFNETDGFAINILAEGQSETSGLFASKRADKFDIPQWKDGPLGHPVLDGVCAWFDCDVEQRIDAGDHIILIGRVGGFDYNEQSGLGYVRGGYVTLGLEQTAVTAAGNAGSVVVGAVVECDGKLLLLKDQESGKYHPIASGLNHHQGSIARLKILLEEFGIGASIQSLFAVFESEEIDRQYIYYRAIADDQNGSGRYFSEEEIPWDQLESSAIETMLKRYLTESREQRYGLYFGNEISGIVQK